MGLMYSDGDEGRRRVFRRHTRFQLGAANLSGPHQPPLGAAFDLEASDIMSANYTTHIMFLQRTEQPQ